MRSTFWAELRRSPLRWWLPVLTVLYVVLLATGDQSWVGVWPRASAAALRPVVFLGPVLAAGAAWTGARSGLPGVADRMRSSARAGWVSDAAQLASSAIIGLGGYLAGVAYVALVSFAQAGPGFLWPGYVLLGAAATLGCAAIGHLAGRTTGSRFGAPVAAGVGCLVLMMAFSSFLGLTSEGADVAGDPAYSVAPDALTSRILLALGLAAAAVTVPSLLGWGAGRWRPALRRWPAGALAVMAVVAAAVLMPAQNVLTARAAPADPACSATVPRVCLWPEDRVYLKDLAAQAARAGRLPRSLFRVPATFYEQGLRPGKPPGDPGGTNGFSLDNGSVSDGGTWFVAYNMAFDVSLTTFGSCVAPSISQASYNKLENSTFLLVQWLATRIYGGPQPPTVLSTGSLGVNPIAIGRLAKESEAAQAAFARAQAKVQDQYGKCRVHARR